ncbi:MAG: DUF4394 domain-containing protein [Alphaproteobacteria bacterium]|nr:DUF4394 domain-containing protein [Alphaproteobacteria bacterium]
MPITSSPRLGACAALGLLLATLPIPAAALDLVGLTDKNQLVLFNVANPGAARILPITGAGGRIIGIDFRPANKQLYGVGADSMIYVIDHASGKASSARKLSVAFDGRKGAVVDFNPQADRLRLMATGGQNLRINVDTGEAAIDKPLAYKTGDAGAGKSPSVTAGAYINSFAGATQTQLFDYDSGTGSWLLQNPPNDGVLTTIGPSGLGSVRIDAVDILTDKDGEYHCFGVAGATLYRIDVATGKAVQLGRVGAGRTKLIDIAFVPVR